MQWQNTVLVLGYPHSKKVFSDVQISQFQFEPIASGPVSGQRWKELGSVFFAPFPPAFVHFNEMLLESYLLQAK